MLYTLLPNSHSIRYCPTALLLGKQMCVRLWQTVACYLREFFACIICDVIEGVDYRWWWRWNCTRTWSVFIRQGSRLVWDRWGALRCLQPFTGLVHCLITHYLLSSKRNRKSERIWCLNGYCSCPFIYRYDVTLECKWVSSVYALDSTRSRWGCKFFTARNWNL